jgi:hypothetical protein
MSQNTLWVRDQLKLYEKRPESWKTNHDEAIHCLDFENWLAYGVFLFECITRVDERHREAAYANPDSYSEDFDREIRGLYEAWSKAIPDSLEQLAYLEKKGFLVEKADEYRRCCEEARGILTPDNEFFVGDKLVALRDAAINSHLVGDTIEGLTH